MSKNYEDLSRRALIKLGKDYDQESDDALLEFLEKNSDEYENVRPIESAIEKIDQIRDTVSDSSSIVKKTLLKQADKVLDSVIDALSNTQLS